MSRKKYTAFIVDADSDTSDIYEKWAVHLKTKFKLKTALICSGRKYYTWLQSPIWMNFGYGIICKVDDIEDGTNKFKQKKIEDVTFQIQQLSDIIDCWNSETTHSSRIMEATEKLEFLERQMIDPKPRPSPAGYSMGIILKEYPLYKLHEQLKSETINFLNEFGITISNFRLEEL